jgi:hypothetical protein
MQRMGVLVHGLAALEVAAAETRKEYASGQHEVAFPLTMLMEHPLVGEDRPQNPQG